MMARNNNNNEATKSKMRSKSSMRKPLKDVSNNPKIKSTAITNVSSFKKASACEGKRKEQTGGDNDSLDRLLLVHSDISSLLRQIDELVVQAIQLTSNKGQIEIKQFAHALSEMQSSLKPWVPRFRKALSDRSTEQDNIAEQPTERTAGCALKEDLKDVTESPELTEWESLVSPSPLVSWRAGCNTESGRQLFRLTPLPQTKTFSSRCHALSISEGAPEPITISGLNKKASKAVANIKNECASPANFPRSNCSMFVMTPCVKMSPPKSCILLEPVSEFSKKNNQKNVHKLTPFPVGVKNSRESPDSESSGGQPKDDLNMKYPDLFGIRLVPNLGNRNNVMENSPSWIVSPPKTCAIMEPTDEKMLPNAAANSLLPKIADGKHHQQVPADLVGTLGIAEITPMVKEPASSFRIGKHPGETTLKKELWTKFEAASTHAIRFKLHKNSEKGFLDRLEEAIRETAIQCLVAMSELPHTRIYPLRIKIWLAISKALDDPKRIVRQEAVRCRQAWASIASRSLHV